MTSCISVGSELHNQWFSSWSWPRADVSLSKTTNLLLHLVSRDAKLTRKIHSYKTHSVRHRRHLQNETKQTETHQLQTMRNLQSCCVSVSLCVLQGGGWPFSSLYPRANRNPSMNTSRLQLGELFSRVMRVLWNENKLTPRGEREEEREGASIPCARTLQGASDGDGMKRTGAFRWKVPLECRCEAAFCVSSTQQSAIWD